jgi:hypothetical protein
MSKIEKQLPVGSDALVLALPDSPGWWWCRFNGGSYLPGDEMCVEVTSVHGDQVIVHWGRDHDYIRPEDQLRDITAWFHGLEWVKAASPWQNVLGHPAAHGKPEFNKAAYRRRMRRLVRPLGAIMSHVVPPPCPFLYCLRSAFRLQSAFSVHGDCRSMRLSVEIPKRLPTKHIGASRVDCFE